MEVPPPKENVNSDEGPNAEKGRWTFGLYQSAGIKSGAQQSPSPGISSSRQSGHESLRISSLE